MKKALALILLLSADGAFGADWCNFPAAATVIDDFVFPTKDCVTPGSRGESVTAVDIRDFVLSPPVGINTTTPDANLDIEDTTGSANVDLLLTGGDGTGTTSSWRLRANGVLGNFAIIDNSNGTAPFKIDQAASVNSLVVKDGRIETGGVVAFCSPPVSAVACTPNLECADDDFKYHCNAAGTEYSRVAISTW